MIIGCLREIKRHEYRVGLTPANAKEYIGHGHTVLIEKGAGTNASFPDAEYQAVGCEIIDSPEQVYGTAEMIVKVKEPLESEYNLLREGQILYTYLHLAASESLTKTLLDRNVSGIAYETITKNGQLPCLAPMSEIAGRLSVQEGMKYLERVFGGRGILLSGAAGVERGKVAVLGAGMVGFNAVKIAAGLGADVTVLDSDPKRLRYIDDVFDGRVTTLYSTNENIDNAVATSDLIIGAVLLPGEKAPKLITRNHIGMMKKGAVLVDVAVDQGGCMETTRPTTHDDPVFLVDGVVCYCVTNMPGAVPLTSTKALTNVTLAYGLSLADLGVEEACRRSEPLRMGMNTFKSACTCKGVAQAFGLPFVHPDSLLN